MKKLISPIVAIVVLTVSLTAIVMANTNDTTYTTTTSDTTSTATTYDATSSSVSSNSIDTLVKHPNFQKHGFEVKEMLEAVKVDRITAIEKAKQVVGEKTSTEAKSITAVLVKFTDKETPKVPESDIILTDYPVWIVTFNGVNLPRHNSKNNVNTTVFADKNVVIDANSGVEIETFAYTSSLK